MAQSLWSRRFTGACRADRNNALADAVSDIAVSDSADTIARWAEVDRVARATMAIDDIEDAGLAIYNARDELVFERMYGDFAPDRRIAVAAASKMVAGLVLFDLSIDGRGGVREFARRTSTGPTGSRRFCADELQPLARAATYGCVLEIQRFAGARLSLTRDSSGRSRLRTTMSFVSSAASSTGSRGPSSVGVRRAG